MSSSHAAARSHNLKTILLIDDDDSFRGALAENLRDDGFDVREYGAVDQLPPLTMLGGVTVAVTDYDMPGSDGLTFADLFHAAHPAVPIVMVTAYFTPDLDAKAAARGFVQLLRKPIDYDDLHALLQQL